IIQVFEINSKFANQILRELKVQNKKNLRTHNLKPFLITNYNYLLYNLFIILTYGQINDIIIKYYATIIKKCQQILEINCLSQNLIMNLKFYLSYLDFFSNLISRYNFRIIINIKYMGLSVHEICLYLFFRFQLPNLK
ncbi:transmembrane protein, putative, partial (macronuclear) [Tetrahymena thermophila SB210]